MFAQTRVMFLRSVSFVLLEKILRVRARELNHVTIARYFCSDRREHDGRYERVAADDGLLGVFGWRAKRAIEPDLSFPFCRL